MSLPATDGKTTPNRAAGSLAEFLHSWRYFIWLLGLLLLAGLFFIEENWRGEWAWNSYKRAMAARGEPTEFSAVVPPRVPDDKNFAMTPFLAPIFDFAPGMSPGNSPFASNYDAASNELKTTNTARLNSWVKNRTDLPAWHAAFLNVSNLIARQEAEAADPAFAASAAKLQRYGLSPLPPGIHNTANKGADRKGWATAADFTVPEAAAGVLAGLSDTASVFEELQVAGKLPCSRFNIHYDDKDPAAILLPHLAVMKRLTQVLSLRACAELALGQTDQAFEDTRLLLRLVDACKDEPLLISQLVRMAQLALALQPVAEGMPRWSEPQLRALQAQLAGFDFCSDARRAMVAERLWCSATIEYIRRSPDKFNQIGGGSGGRQSGLDLVASLMSIAPGGWFALEQLNCSRMVDECLLPTIDLANRQISPRVSRKAEERISAVTKRSPAGLFLRHHCASAFLLPGGSRTARKAAYSQTADDCAIIACALERYHRGKGCYPAALGELQPQFIQKLPHDVINGEPLKYRRTEAGRYLLYSVGWNEKDDGGVISVGKTRDETSLTEGDWVWGLPEG